MERYENIIKIEEIRKLVEVNQYIKALKILETMDVNKVKSLTDLSIMADVLTQNERYDDAMKILVRIYSKTKTRRVLYQLVDLSIKCGRVNEAEDYLERYIKVAPQDSYRFIFRYCIDKLAGEPLEVLIASLEQLKEYEYIEMWAYELAKLYHKAGMKDKCIRECSDIILWFGDGIFVEKAKLLKGYYVGAINPISMLKAKEKQEAQKKLGLDKTKDYTSIREQIDQFLADDQKEKQDSVDSNSTEDKEDLVNESLHETMEVNVNEEEQLLHLWNQYEEDNVGLNSDNESNIELVEDYESDIEAGTGTEIETESEEETNTETESEEKLNIETESEEDINTQTELVDKTNIEKDPEEVNIEPQKEMNFDNTIENNDNLQLELENNANKEYDPENDTNQNSNVAEYQSKYESGRFNALFAEHGMDYNKVFGYFNYIPYCRFQIEQYMEAILTDPTNLHLIITGVNRSGKTSLAKEIAKIMNAFTLIPTSRIAKINADRLNHVNMKEKMNKLKGGTLIIEEASKLNKDTVSDVIQLIKELRGNIIVILEESKENVTEFLENNIELADSISNTIDLPIYSTEDLYGFMEYYFSCYDYHLSDDAKAYLIDYIRFAKTENNSNMLYETVMNLASQAKRTVDERNKKMLFHMPSQLDAQEFLTIKKEDFL